MLWRKRKPAAAAALTAQPAPEAPFAADLRRLDQVLGSRGYRLLFAWRGETLIALAAAQAAPQFSRLSGLSLQSLAARVRAGEFRHLLIRRLRPDGRVGRLIDRTDLLRQAQAAPELLEAWAQGLGAPAPAALPAGERYGEAYVAYLRTLRASTDLIDFLHLGFVSIHEAIEPGADTRRPPFDNPAVLPPAVPAQVKQKSVLFLHNSYYHYNNLADGLKRRGWDTMTVSLTPPDSPHQQFYHGEDLNLYHPDWVTMRDRTREFFATIPERFSALHFYGKGMPSFFYDNCDKPERGLPLPWDMMELRRHRTVVGYMASGSLDGARQSSIRRISGGLCSHCVWELRPDVCNDENNALWAQRLEAMCDWIGLENDWATEERIGRQYVRYPVITALDPDKWRPDIEPPEDMRIVREPGEILVYHAVGNYKTRRVGQRDLKGTGAVMDAIDRLKAEGVPVRLFFATDIPSKVVRYLQVQADIVIDQLNYGRMGANAREALMLGRPLIVKMDARQHEPLPNLAYIEEAPVVSADEDTVYEALKRLIARPDERARLGAAAREFAIKWHSSDACAERFEAIVERVRAGLPPEDPRWTRLEGPSRAEREAADLAHEARSA